MPCQLLLAGSWDLPRLTFSQALPACPHCSGKGIPCPLPHPFFDSKDGLFCILHFAIFM